MPAKCVSSVSPRFHYRRLAFCFLPLAAILESPPIFGFLSLAYFAQYDGTPVPFIFPENNIISFFFMIE
jgi:hypothetical protein